MNDTYKPAHLGFIVDGNRRWAKSRGLSTMEGHEQGLKTLIKVAEDVFSKGVKILSVFVFSTENWNRSKQEVDYLMNLFVTRLDIEVKKLHKNGIRVIFLGNRTEHITPKILKMIEDSEKLTAKNQRGTLVFCFNYGGQLEIAEACQKIIEAGTPASAVTPELISQHLYHPEIPPLDMMVRTSGEQRISNFMLWRINYAEMLFLDKMWPDMTPDDVDLILAEYASRNRRFGGN
jgi:undecaprenyl diphosphate synthase